MKKNIVFACLFAGYCAHSLPMEKKEIKFGENEIISGIQSFKEVLQQEEQKKKKPLEEKYYDQIALHEYLGSVIENKADYPQQMVEGIVSYVVERLADLAKRDKKFDLNKKLFKIETDDTDIDPFASQIRYLPYVQRWPLIIACKKENVAVVQMLLKAGFSATYAHSDKKDTVLSAAQNTKNQQIIELIQNAIADEKKKQGSFTKFIDTLKRKNSIIEQK